MPKTCLALLILLATAPAFAADKDWKDHSGDIPFIVGFEKGMKEAKFTGKPMMVFFTATW